MYNKKRRFHKMNYNDLATKAHENAVKHGFWETNVSNKHCLMLVFTEIAEMVEADRKGIDADIEAFEKYESRIAFDENFERHIKNTLEDEMADIAIRLFDLAGARGIDFDIMFPYYICRNFRQFSFTENAFDLVKGLCRDGIGIEKRIQFGLDFVTKWAQELNIELAFFVAQKMRYNVMRPYRNGKRY